MHLPFTGGDHGAVLRGARKAWNNGEPMLEVGLGLKRGRVASARKWSKEERKLITDIEKIGWVFYGQAMMNPTAVGYVFIRP